MRTPGRPSTGRPGAREESELRGRSARGAARGLAAARRAAGRLAAAGRSCAAVRAARGLTAGGRGVGSGRSRVAPATTRHRGAHEHSRHGRNCQSLRKVHRFSSPGSSWRSVSRWFSFPSDTAPGTVTRYAPRLPRYRRSNRLFCVARAPTLLGSGAVGAVATASKRHATE
jgi:hypothetical protein